MYKVSIIIPTYNRRDSVLRLLTALDDQTFPSNDFEVIVSIDGSSDGTKEMIDKLETSYDLRSLWEQNSGRATACNRGIELAQGEVVIILDDDMEPSRGFVEAHYTLHSCNDSIAVIGSAPVVTDKFSSAVARYIGNKFNLHLKKISNPGYKIKIRDFYSGNFSVKREPLIAMGLYNESFKTYGNEDVELAHRFIKNHISIVFSSDALAEQHYEKDFSGLAKDNRSKGKTVVQLVSMYPEVFPELKLTEYNSSSLKWRRLRAWLIGLSLFCSGTEYIIVRTMNILGKLVPSKTDYLYQLALDYFFWLGVWRTIKEDKNRELKLRIMTYGLG